MTDMKWKVITDRRRRRGVNGDGLHVLLESRLLGRADRLLLGGAQVLAFLRHLPVVVFVEHGSGLLRQHRSLLILESAADSLRRRLGAVERAEGDAGALALRLDRRDV